MERRGHRQQHRALGALGFGDLDGAIDRGLVAGDDHLSAAIVVGGLADLPLRRLLGDLQGGLVVEAKQSGHRAGANRHGFLHCETAGAKQPRGVGNRQAAGRSER
jgi:hypothetical protein